ncbi:hypothetical protein GPECTOR_424g287 [Gonium pectorale]|uniref:Uncharacterized protein n=1 Tax=Gonium pectorale TaxID=33097 RepID=A0A150FV77_GONPE|nr:hypothetical protein GPECTOR_424g287 [Gonium pectorale]|eukprot:KXZ41506.1 hypothetical protein GPECTOR_424g287 [Gonium pectorale]
MAPHRIRAALSDPASRVNLLSFMESIMCQWLPSPDLWGESLDVLPTCCPDGIMTPELRSMCEDLGSALTAAVVPFKARQVPLSGPHACTAAELLRFVALVVLEVNFHHHKPTCVHYRPGVVAGDCNCRARFPRCLKWASQVDEATGCVHLKRYGKWLVPYTRSLMLAQPCNHMVYFTCEIGRWVRDLELWRQRNPGLALDDPAAPRLPLLEDLAADAADYALKYATKAETTEGSMAILASAILLAQRQALERYVERMQPPAAAAAAEVAKGMAASASTYGPAPPAGAPGAPTLPRISTASQPLADPPLRPADDAPADAREAYAAWALGNFAAYGSAMPLTCPPGGLWAAWKAFNADTSLPARIAAHLLQNCQSRAQSRARAATRCAQAAAAAAAAAGASGGNPDAGRAALLAATAGMEDDGDEGLIGSGDEDGNADDPDSGAASLPDPFQPASMQPGGRLGAATLDAAAAAQLRVALTANVAPPTASAREATFLEEALRAAPPVLPGNLPPTVSVGPSQPGAAVVAGTCVSSSTADTIRRDMVAAAEGHALFSPQPAGSQVQALRLLQAGTANVRAQLLLYNAADRAPPTLRDIPAGEPPPYALLPESQKPSMEDTARLFNLSPDQQRPFYLLAATLLADERCKQPPLGMAAPLLVTP